MAALLPAPDFGLLADAVLGLHGGVVAFVVGGWAATVAGNTLWRWAWVNRVGFRLLHAGAIAVVALQSWAGVACPLTTLEMWLRRRAGQPAYADSFIGHWLQRLLYVDAPAWAFVLAYTAFGLAVAATWWRWPPVQRRVGPRPRPIG